MNINQHRIWYLGGDPLTQRSSDSDEEVCVVLIEVQ